MDLEDYQAQHYHAHPSVFSAPSKPPLLDHPHAHEELPSFSSPFPVASPTTFQLLTLLKGSIDRLKRIASMLGHRNNDKLGNNFNNQPPTAYSSNGQQDEESKLQQEIEALDHTIREYQQQKERLEENLAQLQRAKGTGCSHYFISSEAAQPSHSRNLSTKTINCITLASNSVSIMHTIKQRLENLMMAQGIQLAGPLLHWTSASTASQLDQEASLTVIFWRINTRMTGEDINPVLHQISGEKILVLLMDSSNTLTTKDKERLQSMKVLTCQRLLFVPGERNEAVYTEENAQALNSLCTSILSPPKN